MKAAERERAALLLSRMFTVDEADQLIALLVAGSGWRLGDLLARTTARTFFLALVGELADDRRLAVEFVAALRLARPRRAADVETIAFILGVDHG